MDRRKITLSFAVPAKSGSSNIDRIKYYDWGGFVEYYSDLKNWCACNSSNDKLSKMELIVGGLCEGKRSNNNTSYRSVLILDIDNDLNTVLDDYISIEFVEKKLSAYEYFLYTTFSHTKGCERFRVVIPLSEDISSSDWQQYRKSLIEHFPYADKSCFVLSQGQGVPTYQVKNKGDAYFYHNQGKYFDLMNEVVLIKPKAIYENFEYKIYNYENDYIAKVVKGVVDYNAGSMRRTDAFIFTCFMCANSIIDYNAVRSVSLPDTKTTPEMHYGNAVSGHIKYMWCGWTPERMQKYLPNGYLASIWKASQPVQKAVEPYDFMPSYNRFDEAKKEAQSNGWEYYELNDEQRFSEIAPRIQWEDGINLLISDCATGKTYYWVDIPNSVMVVPYITITSQNVREGQTENDIFGGIGTYNQVKKLLDDKDNYAKYKEMTLVVDEGHVMYADAGYRSNEIRDVRKAMTLFKSVVIMSGTIRPEHFSDLDIKKVVRVTKHYSFEKLIRSYRVRDTVVYSIGKIRDTTNKALVLVNNKDDINNIITAIPDKKFININRDTKKSSEVREVISDKLCADYDVIIGTQSIVEGVSFEDELEEADVIIIDTPKSSFSTERIEQVSNRWRRAGKINVYHYIIKSKNVENEFPTYMETDGYIRIANENMRIANIKFLRCKTKKDKDSFINTYKHMEKKEFITFDYYSGEYVADYIMIDKHMSDVRASNDKLNVLQYMSELQKYGFRFINDEYMFKIDLDDVRNISKDTNKLKWIDVVNEVKDTYDFNLDMFTGSVNTEQGIELQNDIRNAIEYGLCNASIPMLFRELEKSKNSKNIMKKIKEDSLDYANGNSVIDFIGSVLPKLQKVYGCSKKQLTGLDSEGKRLLAQEIIDYVSSERFDSQEQIALTEFGKFVDGNGVLLDNDKAAHALLSMYVKLENHRLKEKGKDIRISTIAAMNRTGYSFK